MFKLIVIFLMSVNFLFAEVYSDEFELDDTSSKSKDSISFLIEEGNDYLKNLKKDVFETSMEFRQRKEDEKNNIQNNILNIIKEKVDVDGSGTANMLQYDADASLMTFKLNWLSFNDDFLKNLQKRAFLTIKAKDAKDIFQKIRKHKFYIDLKYENDIIVLDKAYILYKDKILNLFFRSMNSPQNINSINSEELIPLTIKTSQTNTKIIITNIRPKYYDGIKLKKGKYTIIITKRGYSRLKRTILLGDKKVFNFSLKKLRVKRRIRYVPVNRSRQSNHRRGATGWE